MPSQKLKANPQGTRPRQRLDRGYFPRGEHGVCGSEEDLLARHTEGGPAFNRDVFVAVCVRNACIISETDGKQLEAYI